MSKSPTAIKMLRFGFNLIDDGLVGRQVYTVRQLDLHMVQMKPKKVEMEKRSSLISIQNLPLIMKAWLLAFRLRTLPLSLSCILIGSTLAWDSSEDFCYRFVLLVVTTGALQFANVNDYGDSENGADNLERIE